MPWLFLLSLWLIALIAVAAGYAAWNRMGLRLLFDARRIRPAAGSPLEELPEQLLRTAPLPAATFEGDALELEVGLTTTGRPRGPAGVTCLVGGQKVGFSTGVVPRAGWRRSIDVPRLRRGALGATSWEILSGDFLGLFRARQRRPDTEVALVLPRFASLRDRRRAHELEASVAAPRSGAGSELFGVREYRTGDSLRRIHWRSSARRGQLVVREYEPPGVQTLLLLLDPVPATVELADQIARIAASEAWDCIREGGRVVISAPGLEPSQSPRDLWGLLEWLARYPAAPSAAFGDTLPVRAEEVVVLTAGDRAVLEEADIAAGRGARVRAWVIGDAQIEVDVPAERVGLQWPL